MSWLRLASVGCQASPLWLQVELAQRGLPALVVQLLRQASPLDSLPLLEMLRCMYEQHPRPKEFIIKFGVAEQLRRMIAVGSQNGAQLVPQKAQSLLDAFSMNSVF